MSHKILFFFLYKVSDHILLFKYINWRNEEEGKEWVAVFWHKALYSPTSLISNLAPSFRHLYSLFSIYFPTTSQLIPNNLLPLSFIYWMFINLIIQFVILNWQCRLQITSELLFETKSTSIYCIFGNLLLTTGFSSFFPSIPQFIIMKSTGEFEVWIQVLKWQ